VSEPIPFTERFVARADTARSMAKVFVADRLRTRRLLIFFGIYYVLMTIVIVGGLDADLELGARVFWALVYAVVPLALIIGAVVLIMYTATTRNVGKRITEGTVLESGFGTDALVLRSPLSESRITYASITTLKQRGDFVFLGQIGVPLSSGLPRELFPDTAIERIRAAMR